MQRVTQNLVGGRALVTPMPRKKVPERHSDLCPSEKELPERHSGVFHHRNTPVYFYRKSAVLYGRPNILLSK
jgi:hypothetical protein